MNDLRARFDSLDRVIVPDVWDEVQRRVAALETSTTPSPVVRVIPGPNSRTSRTPIGRSSERHRVWWLIAAALMAVALLAGGLIAGGSHLLSLVLPSQTGLSLSPTVVAPSPFHRGPTNGLIAYSSDGQIFVAAPDGTNRRALTPAGGNAFQPRWSPNGDQLAFLAVSCAVGQPCDRKAGPISLVVTNPDGSERQILEDNLQGVQTLEWSPDGKRLAFEAESPFGVRVLAIDTHETRTVGVGEYPRWSPDGTTLAYEHAGSTHLVAADGTGERLLLQPTAAGLAIGARWSPDGSELAFVWKRACCPPANRASDAWLVDRSGNSPHRMSEVPDGATFEGWSPDGRSILYLDTSQPDATFAWPLVAAQSDGSDPRSVGKINSVPMYWSPDGTRLFLIEGQEGSTSRLVIIDPTGVASQIEIPADGASWQSIP